MNARRLRHRQKKLHITGPDFATIQTIGRPFFAFDAAGDLERLGVVIGCGRFTILIVDGERHLSHIAGRAAGRAVENDVIHTGGAQALVRAFAHHPAECLNKIGFAATIRPDNPGQTGFDQEFCGIDEGFEPCDL